MNDTERDARIAEVQVILDPQGDIAGIRNRAGQWLPWEARKGTAPTTKCSTADCGFDAWISLCHKHYVEALDDYQREHPRSLAQRGRPIDDSIPDRVYTEPLQSWMEAVRRQVKANAQSAQDSKNLAEQAMHRAQEAAAKAVASEFRADTSKNFAEQACARTEAAVYCLAEYSDSADQPQRCRMDKGHVGGHTQNPAATKHRNR